NNTMGLFLADQNQHIDSFTFVDHAVSDCTSSQNFKGILDDKATGAFTGKILVRKDAQRTIAYQTNNNICLSNEAVMKSKPILEIYADDVKCSHGATVGQLDQNALFYMQSRGISLRESRLLLMYAFGAEILKKVQIIPLRERLDDLIDKRLRGELSRCNCCPLNCE
ncbi:MAG: SufD family Fe-S cluster assembly protein, partial [Bacteroidales bacterium]|nr:SufD family Fe-S cluster assembly protein [Bacteroidales bacterium]